MLILHHNRRDLLAKTLFDVFKLSLVAACVSGFFATFDMATKNAIYSIMGSSFIFGLILCPTSKKEQ